MLTDRPPGRGLFAELTEVREAGLGTDVEERAEEAADQVDEDIEAELPITDTSGIDDLAAEALSDAVVEPIAAPVPDEPEPVEPEPAPAPAAGTCDDCGAALTPTVVAYCQSPRGQATFSGANYCFGCQKKHRPARKAVAQ